jgi:galactoside O-acetyltransferase
MDEILNPGYYDESDLDSVGFRKLGSNVKIARDAIIIGFENIEIGSNIRIDSNVTLAVSSGFLTLGDYIHIGGGSHLSCSGGLKISNFANISQGVRIYSASDDYSGESMTNPTLPTHLTNVYRAEIIIEEHVIIGSGSVILPGVVLRRGTAIGALSLVKKSTDEFTIYAGSPAKRIGARSMKVLEISKNLA